MNCMPDSSYTYQIEDILGEINQASGRRLELEPSRTYPIWDSTSAHFKIHDRLAAPGRVMELSVPATDFCEGVKTKKLSAAAISKIAQEIDSFFDVKVHSVKTSAP
jgi:hypothetical protein